MGKFDHTIGRMMDYELPDYMVGPMQRYLEHGIPPGGFLTAVLENDLFAAVSRADQQNLASLKDWVVFIYNEVPNSAHGSPEKVDKWVTMHFEEEKASK